MDRCSEYQQKLSSEQTLRYTGLISLVWQCMVVCGCHVGTCLGEDFTFFTQVFRNRELWRDTCSTFGWTVCVYQSEWYGRSLYDLIHPDDIEKLREQLSTSETQPPGRILDLKSMYSFTLLHLLIALDAQCICICIQCSNLNYILLGLAFVWHLFM